MKRAVLYSCLFAAALIAVSCASAPPEAPAPEQPAVAAQPAAPESERASARSLMDVIETYGLASYDEESYAQGAADLAAGEESYDVDNAASKESFQAAIQKLSIVAEKGWAVILPDMERDCAASRTAADDLLAAVAVKDDYAKADAVYQQAVAEKNRGDNAKAYDDFFQARELFDAAAGLAWDKKTAAEDALSAAQEGKTASESKAAQADKSLSDEGITIEAGGQEGGN